LTGIRRGSDLVVQLGDRHFVREARAAEVLVKLDTYAEHMYGKVLSGKNEFFRLCIFRNNFELFLSSYLLLGNPRHQGHDRWCPEARGPNLCRGLAT
jgi:hypothetical protein